MKNKIRILVKYSELEQFIDHCHHFNAKIHKMKHPDISLPSNMFVFSSSKKKLQQLRFWCVDTDKIFLQLSDNIYQFVNEWKNG